MDLNDFDEYGWKKSNKPWKSMQERFCPDFKDKVGEKKKNKIIKSLSPSLFDIAKDKERNATPAEKDIVASVENSPNAGTVIKRTILHDEDLDIFISKLDYLSDYQKRQIAFAVKSVIKQHSHDGRQFQETSYEDIISHIKRYCLAKSKKTGNYFCLRGDNLEDVEAVNKVCEELMKRYANK